MLPSLAAVKVITFPGVTSADEGVTSNEQPSGGSVTPSMVMVAVALMLLFDVSVTRMVS